MSMARTSEKLTVFLADSDSKVLALSGKWGTGKSHMWKGIRGKSENPLIKSALYVSLFGIVTLSELKLKLAQSAVPLVDKKGPALDTVVSAVKTAVQTGKTFFSGLPVFDELAYLVVPALVRNKFIVIDDIERKHEKLSIDEILGFIDDFTQNYGCRFLLILNTDQLADKTVWEKLREKVIDDEVRLETTPAEAFDIAVELSPTSFGATIKPAVVSCGITNIRIIRKVIRAVERIVDSRETLPNDVLSRIVPSTVLLAAIHYKGIEDGPTMSFMLDFGSSTFAEITQQTRQRRGEAETDDDRMRARWRVLLQRLGIVSADEYEGLVAEYLQSGLFDKSKLDETLNRYLAESNLAGAQKRVRDFFQSIIWNPQLTDEEVVAQAQGLSPDLRYLDAYTITALYDYLIKFKGGEVFAEKMVTEHVSLVRSRAAADGANLGQFVLDDPFGRPVHPCISAAYSEARAQVENPRTLLNVVMAIVQGGGWNPADENIMQSASNDDFFQTIINLQGEQLKLFLLKNVEIYANRSTYEKHFGSAPDNFLHACQRVVTDRVGTRWEALIKSVFADSNIVIARSLPLKETSS